MRLCSNYSRLAKYVEKHGEEKRIYMQKDYWEK